MLTYEKDGSEKIPLDAKLLSYAIIELNISRRNVAIYPRDHPSVESSLSNAFKFLKQLFEIRSHITLAVARDTIIIDQYHLDKKNPVFRDFALNLSRMHIAFITLKKGIDEDELYTFHRFITEKVDDVTVDDLQKSLKDYCVPHIDIGFVDYRKFATGGLKTSDPTHEAPLWERYIYGLLEGTLQGEEASGEVADIPPEILAGLLNRVSDEPRKEEVYEKVITTYMSSSSEGIFSGRDLKRLMDFIDRLRPDLKQRFLSSAVKTFSENGTSAYQSLHKMSVDEIEKFLDTVNRQQISIPPVLRNLVDKFSYNPEDVSEGVYLEEDLIEDEELFPSHLEELFTGDGPEEHVDIPPSAEDLQEIQNLVNLDAADFKTSHLIDFDNEFNEDLTEKRFNQIILDLMLSEIPSEAEYRIFADIVKEQSGQLLWIGQYGQISKILRVLEANKAGNRFSAISAKALQYFHSPEFMVLLVDSLKLLGRQMRAEVWGMCDYYDKTIIPYLMDALIEEESPSVRRFLLDLLGQFGNKVIGEAVERLNDARWFVKRNMLYILRDLDIKEASEYIRPHCNDENSKVRLTALKCLLSVRDAYAVETIRRHLTSDSQELFQQALSLAASFKVEDTVGDLVRLLERQVLTGADILNKIPIVRTLGEIGDPRALDALRSLLSMRSVLHRKNTDRLKVEIYKTLKNYPYEAIKDLIESGLSSTNKIIRDQSLLLRKEDE